MKWTIKWRLYDAWYSVNVSKQPFSLTLKQVFSLSSLFSFATLAHPNTYKMSRQTIGEKCQWILSSGTAGIRRLHECKFGDTSGGT